MAKSVPLNYKSISSYISRQNSARDQIRFYFKTKSGRRIVWRIVASNTKDGEYQQRYEVKLVNGLIWQGKDTQSPSVDSKEFAKSVKMILWIAKNS